MNIFMEVIIVMCRLVANYCWAMYRFIIDRPQKDITGQVRVRIILYYHVYVQTRLSYIVNI